jgi:hypothetical protein
MANFWKIYISLFLLALIIGGGCSVLATQDKEFILKVQFKEKESCDTYMRKFISRGFVANCEVISYE